MLRNFTRITPKLLLFIYTCAWAHLFTPMASAEFKPLTISSLPQKQVFSYIMSGRIRLLLFWVGRENVGGGKVTIEKTEGFEPLKHKEKITVLFGTNPDRVPWRINRWGYGEEIGYWSLEGATAGALLRCSRFTGFIRHSPEESISQISSSRAQEQEKYQYWYDGITSLVKPDEAQTEIYNFPLVEEVTSARMDMALRAFESRRSSGPADKSRKFSNQPQKYDSPQGFLLCLKRMLIELSRSFKTNQRVQGWVAPKIRASYVYNARNYHLQLKRVKIHKNFRLGLPAATKTRLPSGSLFHDVAEAGMDIVNADSGERHRFTCWAPMEGPLESIPIQIQDNPRWWLQVRLQLVDME
jgi:hypothetical protein